MARPSVRTSFQQFRRLGELPPAHQDQAALVGGLRAAGREAFGPCQTSLRLVVAAGGPQEDSRRQLRLVAAGLRVGPAHRRRHSPGLGIEGEHAGLEEAEGPDFVLARRLLRRPELGREEVAPVARHGVGEEVGRQVVGREREALQRVHEPHDAPARISRRAQRAERPQVGVLFVGAAVGEHPRLGAGHAEAAHRHADVGVGGAEEDARDQRRQRHHLHPALGLDASGDVAAGDVADLVGDHPGQFLLIGHGEERAGGHVDVAARHGEGVHLAVGHDERPDGEGEIGNGRPDTVGHLAQFLLDVGIVGDREARRDLPEDPVAELPLFSTRKRPRGGGKCSREYESEKECDESPRSPHGGKGTRIKAGTEGRGFPRRLPANFGFSPIDFVRLEKRSSTYCPI